MEQFEISFANAMNTGFAATIRSIDVPRSLDDTIPNSMSRLQRTFDTLRDSTVHSAAEVLMLALEDANPQVRRMALNSILSSKNPGLAERLLDQWQTLGPDEIAQVRQRKQCVARTIEQRIQAGNETTPTAIDAAVGLELTSLLLPMITLAESCSSLPIKRQAAEAIVQLVEPLGQRAKQNRDQSTIRGPVRARLKDSVECFAMHRHERLIDAFLEISAWPDSELRELLSRPSPTRDLICDQLRKTTVPGAVGLLAGFVRRHDLPDCIAQVIQFRSDTLFRDAFLDAVTGDPGPTTQKNLQRIGTPRCCEGGERLVDEVDVDRLSSLIHVYVLTQSDPVSKLQTVAAAAQRGGDACMGAAAIGFSHCEPLDTDYWMRAAIPVADGDPAVIENDENARLLNRLINMLEHSDGALVRSVQQVLAPLHVENMIDRLDALRPRSRRRLGRVVRMIDAGAITRVHDSLRHPVLANRLNAIAMAETLGCVDQVHETLAHLVREDHQNARILAAEVMGNASGRETMALLEEMTLLPDCGVRDAALAAIENRKSHQCV